MAKFTTALCILLVACSGAQASIFSTTTDYVTAAIEAFIAQIAEGQAELSTAVAAGVESMANASATINATLQASAATADAALTALKEKAEGDISCFTSSINFTETAQTFAESIANCSADAVSGFQTDYEEVLAEYEAINITLSAAAAEVAGCSANILTYPSCVAAVYVTVEVEIAAQMATVLAKSAALTASMTDVAATVAACNESGLEDFHTEVAEALAEIEACVVAASEVTSE